MPFSGRWFVFAVLLCFCAGCAVSPPRPAKAAPPRRYTPPPASSVPTLEGLAGEWQDVSDLRSMPGLSSLQGTALATRNVLAVGDLSFPPITLYGSTGALQIDGVPVDARKARWYPYQVLRQAQVGALEVRTAVRLPFESAGLLYHIVLTNHGPRPRRLTLSLPLTSSISRHDRWSWAIPRDPPSGQSASVLGGGQTVEIREAANGLCSAFCFARPPQSLNVRGASGEAAWSLTLAPGQAFVLDFAEAMGVSEPRVRQAAVRWAGAFGATFDRVRGDWQKRYQAMFTPGNAIFSGSLPVLETSDAALRRVYYESALTLLCVCRTNLPLAPRAYITNAPQTNGIMMYFWDTHEWATSLALLDPRMLRLYLVAWLTKGIHDGYAEEYLTGSLQGPWYSANDLSVFMLIDAYVNVTGDRAFLSEAVGGKTVLQHLVAISTYWKRLVHPGRTLADYGGAANLLECVPTYINEVPSFNAADVWMMRRAATAETAEGSPALAASLRADAASLASAVLALYEPGQGVWDSLHEDGKRVPMRHVLDFATVGLTMTDWLTPQVRREMVGFVEKELIVDHWMRAESLRDPAASYSDRPDHGPMGAFSAWPAETMATLCEFGDYARALDLMHRIAPVTAEGPFSQSRELLGRSSDSVVRIAGRGDQTYYASCGASFVDTVVRGFFGYQPDAFGKSMIHDARAHGFSGRLLNVRQGARLYDIVSSSQGVTIAPARRPRTASCRTFPHVTRRRAGILTTKKRQNALLRAPTWGIIPPLPAALALTPLGRVSAGGK